MDHRAKKLLSAEALPRVEVPRPASHSARRFRLPSCIAAGGPVVEAGTPLEPHRGAAGSGPASGSFRDPTLAWFRQGDELADHDADGAAPAPVVAADRAGRRARVTARHLYVAIPSAVLVVLLLALVL